MRTVVRTAGFLLLCVATGGAWTLNPYGGSLITDSWWLVNTAVFAAAYVVARRSQRGHLVLSVGYLSIGALGVALAWWHLWMYAGWPGTPRLLHSIIAVDGESSYNATLIEMFVMTFTAFALAVAMGALTFRWIGRAKSGAPLT